MYESIKGQNEMRNNNKKSQAKHTGTVYIYIYVCTHKSACVDALYMCFTHSKMTRKSVIGIYGICNICGVSIEVRSFCLLLIHFKAIPQSGIVAMPRRAHFVKLAFHMGLLKE